MRTSAPRLRRFSSVRSYVGDSTTTASPGWTSSSNRNASACIEPLVTSTCSTARRRAARRSTRAAARSRRSCRRRSSRPGRSRRRAARPPAGLRRRRCRATAPHGRRRSWPWRWSLAPLAQRPHADHERASGSLRGRVADDRGPAALPASSRSMSRSESWYMRSRPVAALPSCVRGCARPLETMPGGQLTSACVALPVAQLDGRGWRSRRRRAAWCRGGSACRSASCRPPRRRARCRVDDVGARPPARRRRRPRRRTQRRAAARRPWPRARRRPRRRAEQAGERAHPDRRDEHAQPGPVRLQPVAELAAGRAGLEVAQRVLGRPALLVVRESAGRRGSRRTRRRAPRRPRPARCARA